MLKILLHARFFINSDISNTEILGQMIKKGDSATLHHLKTFLV